MDSPARGFQEIARISAHLDAGTQRLLELVRKFDESGEWFRQNARSCAHWLMWRIGLTRSAAYERVRIATALGQLPRIDEALGKGEISYAKVRAMSRVATPQNEETLLSMARHSTGNQMEKICRLLKKVNCITEYRDSLDEYREVSDTQLPSGMVRITMVLHADEAEMVMKAIQKAREEAPLVEPEPPKQEVPTKSSAEDSATKSSAEDNRPVRTAPRMIPRADAVMKIAQSFLATGEKRSNSAERYQVFLHLQQDPFGAPGELAACLDNGTRVSAETLMRITCDCCLVPSVDDEKGDILNLGRRRRTINPALRRALQHRDGGCRYPGCTNGLFVSGHHIKHWMMGGETSKANTCLLCYWHHLLLHEGRFTMEGGAGGELIFRDTKGNVVSAVPRRPTGLLVRLEQEQRDLEIDEDTNCPGWDGDPVQYGACIDALVR